MTKIKTIFSMISSYKNNRKILVIIIKIIIIIIMIIIMIITLIVIITIIGNNFNDSLSNMGAVNGSHNSIHKRTDNNHI